MGGENAPDCVVHGAALALKRHPKLRFQFYGDSARLEPLLHHQPRLKACSKIIHTDDLVAADAKPSVALRQGTKSSMRLAINAVKEGKADAVVSSGNTGALMAISKVVLRTLPHINRPALISTLPTLKRNCVMLDMGANVEADAQNLCQFAVMGDAFARALLGINSPTIALLNVGAEEIKGHDTLKTAYNALKEVHNLNFQGFCEGTDIGRGNVDVVVTDGFTGNITLKTIEGTAHFVATSLKRALKSSIFGMIGYIISNRALIPFKRKMDPRSHNGAVFIGLNGITVKSHGNADTFAFANAVGLAYELVHSDVNGKIIEELSRAHLDSSLETMENTTGEKPQDGGDA